MSATQKEHGLSARLKELHKAHAEGAFRLLDTYDATDAEGFSAIIEWCINMGLRPADLADEFMVSESTVSRWRHGRNLPVVYVRGTVVSRIRAMLASSELIATPRKVLRSSKRKTKQKERKARDAVHVAHAT